MQSNSHSNVLTSSVKIEVETTAAKKKAWVSSEPIYTHILVYASATLSAFSEH